MASLAYSVLHLTTPTTTYRSPTSFLLPPGGGLASRLSVTKPDGSITGSITRPCLPVRRFTRSRFTCKSELISNIAPLASAAYGVLLLGGGLFAYSKSESKGSLFGGLTGAVLMGTVIVALFFVGSIETMAYRLMLEPETKPVGDALAFGSALLFASVFGIRLASTRKVMPGGVLLGLSLGAMAVFYSAYLQDKM